MVVGTAHGLDFNSAEVWRIERAAGITLKRPLAVPPGNFFPTVTLDTDASGCTISYAGGRSQNGDVLDPGRVDGAGNASPQARGAVSAQYSSSGGLLIGFQMQRHSRPCHRCHAALP